MVVRVPARCRLTLRVVAGWGNSTEWLDALRAGGPKHEPARIVVCSVLVLIGWGREGKRGVVGGRVERAREEAEAAGSARQPALHAPA